MENSKKNFEIVIKLKEIFAFRQTGLTPNHEVDGEFILYNYRPLSYEKIKLKGIDDIDDIFANLKCPTRKKDTDEK